MAFNTKINLDNGHVIQPDDSQLTLSGNTIIASVGDLRYQTHPNFTGTTQIVDKQYVDLQVISGVTGGTLYNLGSPAAVEVGGIDVGYVLSGKSTNCILQDMLYPELCGVLTAPSMTSLVLAPSTSPLEIGTVISSLSVTANFSRGSINPQYCSASPYRSGAANCYCFTGSINGLVACTADSAVTGITNYTVLAGANTWGSRVCYDAGVQPKSNKNINFSSPLGSGLVTLCENTITGILPYFYGVSDTVPTPGSALIATGTKVVATSTGQININFGTNTGKYLWFATPNASTTKLGWYEGPTNKGNIGSGSDLFNAPATPSVDSPSGCWTAETYKVYSSNYSTNTSGTVFCMTNTTQQ
jgi:hypothetical protein